ncbi:HAD-IA family hydrolase [Curtobacterium sp. 9128]|uniref:HAD-IA family hydrolase n=1 Tax=Curtobacterium sp. 9128 TaxID=1793722 RepID=UPI0011A721CA|nr:HAD-IA family hydrolase [Curtobacterium sp. 9128]
MGSIVTGDAAWRPHHRVSGTAAAAAITSLGAVPTREALVLAESVDRTYRAWPDVPDATAALRREHVVAGLSNGDLDALARVANTERISWDVVLSTGPARTFKPAPAAYEYAVDALRLDPRRTLFTAAHPWDLRAAAEHGFRTAYVARPGAERPVDEDRFDLTVPDLAALSALLA